MIPAEVTTHRALAGPGVLDELIPAALQPRRPAGHQAVPYFRAGYDQHLRTAMVESAWATARTATRPGARFRRLARRFGRGHEKKAAVAVAHTLINATVPSQGLSAARYARCRDEGPGKTGPVPPWCGAADTQAEKRR